MPADTKDLDAIYYQEEDDDACRFLFSDEALGKCKISIDELETEILTKLDNPKVWTNGVS